MLYHFFFFLQILCCLLLAVAFVISAPIDSDPTDTRKREDIPSIGDPDNFLMLKLLKLKLLGAAILG